MHPTAEPKTSAHRVWVTSGERRKGGKAIAASRGDLWLNQKSARQGYPPSRPARTGSTARSQGTGPMLECLGIPVAQRLAVRF